MSTTLSLDLVNQADRFLDTEAQQKRAQELGDALYDAFLPDKTGRISTQIRNLEQVVVSATRFCDIEDFVKNQMGREGDAAQKWRDVGGRVLDDLHKLRAKAQELAGNEAERLLLRLHLARGWIRSVVGAYLYKKAMKQLEARHAQR